MDENDDGGFSIQDLTQLIGAGSTAALALYSGISGNPVSTYPVMNPAAGLPGVARVPSGATAGLAGVFANPWVLALGAIAIVALLWHDGQ